MRIKHYPPAKYMLKLKFLSAVILFGIDLCLNLCILIFHPAKVNQYVITQYATRGSFNSGACAFVIRSWRLMRCQGGVGILNGSGGRKKLFRWPQTDIQSSKTWIETLD